MEESVLFSPLFLQGTWLAGGRRREEEQHVHYSLIAYSYEIQHPPYKNSQMTEQQISQMDCLKGNRTQLENMPKFKQPKFKTFKCPTKK